jgi:hypothetical protein
MGGQLVPQKEVPPAGPGSILLFFGLLDVDFLSFFSVRRDFRKEKKKINNYYYFKGYLQNSTLSFN